MSDPVELTAEQKAIAAVADSISKSLDESAQLFMDFYEMGNEIAKYTSLIMSHHPDPNQNPADILLVLNDIEKMGNWLVQLANEGKSKLPGDHHE